MSIHVKSENKVEVIYLDLEIDLDTTQAVKDQIKKSLETSNKVHVDLSKVSYIDSSGIASLIEGMQIAKRMNKEFGLVNVSNEVIKVIKLAHLDTVFNIISETNKSANS
jgi:anti-sigma B factor antagonist